MEICFGVSNLRVGSALLRGYQVSQALSQHGIVSKTIDWGELAAETLPIPRDCDIVMLVKEWHPGLAMKIKQQTRAKLILDVCDNYHLHRMICHKNEHFELVDAFVVTGTYHQIALSRFFLDEKKPIWVIPHHHTNFRNIVNDVTKPVKSIGFQGDTLNRLPRSFEEELQGFCSLHGLEWLTFYTQKARKQCATLPFEEINDVIHHQLNLIDVGIIFPPKRAPQKPAMSVDDPLFELLLFKPATRLLNFFSHGIPAVSYPYVSNLEVCVQSGYDLFCSDKECLFSILESLIKDQSLRQSAFTKGQRIATHYSLDSLILKYIALFESIL